MQNSTRSFGFESTQAMGVVYTTHCWSTSSCCLAWFAEIP